MRDCQLNTICPKLSWIPAFGLMIDPIVALREKTRIVLT